MFFFWFGRDVFLLDVFGFSRLFLVLDLFFINVVYTFFVVIICVCLFLFRERRVVFEVRVEGVGFFREGLRMVWVFCFFADFVVLEY